MIWYSSGSYSRSASWMITSGAVTDSTAVRIAAPLPRFAAWRWTLTLRSLRKRSATSNVPSADPSSTTTSCWTQGCRRTRWRTRPRVGASLKAGTITARFASILLQLTPPAKICSGPRNPPPRPSPARGKGESHCSGRDGCARQGPGIRPAGWALPARLGPAQYGHRDPGCSRLGGPRHLRSVASASLQRRLDVLVVGAPAGGRTRPAQLSAEHGAGHGAGALGRCDQPGAS